MIRFSGVVVDNIQDDLNSVGMQSRNQFFEFFNRRLRLRSISKVWTEKIERHVAPVIVFLWIKLMNRHELNNRDAELNQVRNLLNNSGESSTAYGGYGTAGTSGKSPHVHFINDRVRVVTRW